MNPAVAHAAVTAILIVLAGATAFAVAVVACAMLRPEPQGRHRLDGDKAAAHFRSLRETPAPGHGPVQAPGPADPPRPNGAVRARATLPAPRGAARAGQAPGPAAQARAPQPDAAPEPVPPGDDGAAAAPAPNGPPSIPRGPGQPYRARVRVEFPDNNIAILDEHGQWHVKPLAWDGRRDPDTGGQRVLVRGGYEAHEAWRDAAVNVP